MKQFKVLALISSSIILVFFISCSHSGSSMKKLTRSSKPNIVIIYLDELGVGGNWHHHENTEDAGA